MNLGVIVKVLLLWKDTITIATLLIRENINWIWLTV